VLLYNNRWPAAYDQQFIQMRHSAYGAGGFRIIADSYDCVNTVADGGIVVLDVPAVQTSHLPGQPPPKGLGLTADNTCPCWQTQFWSVSFFKKLLQECSVRIFSKNVLKSVPAIVVYVMVCWPFAY
jgi:hypothetical protein